MALVSTARFTRFTRLLILVGCVAGIWTSVAEAQRPGRKPDASDTFFSQGQIPTLKIEITPANLDQLRQNARIYARCKIVEDDSVVYKQAGVKLKGAAGSFRGVDDRPALTINIDKFENGQTFHGLDKFHLNNSVQDPTFLHEYISSELFAMANLPAARTTHARVWINQRDLGVYVLKEGFAKHFLQRYYTKANGNLYDGGFCQDIDGPLQKDSGDGDDNREDLKQLIQACREPDLKQRPAKIEQILDVDQFLGFLVMESITCHWDGYCYNRNNYRVYFPSETKKAVFFPHGMDQMFRDANFNLLAAPAPTVPSGLLQCPEYQARYLKKVRQLAPLITDTEPLLKKVDAAHERLKPVLMSIHPDRVKEHANAATQVKNQIVARANGVRQMLSQLPTPIEFDGQGRMLVVDWRSVNEAGDMKFAEEKTPDGREAYLIHANSNGNNVASWRRKLTLPAGKYRFEVLALANGVVPFEDARGKGAGVRISGSPRTNQLIAAASWTTLEHPFEIAEAQREVELVAELRATQGKVWFAKDSLRIVKLP